MDSERCGVSADLPNVLMGQFLRWKIDRGFATDSQALIALLELFFSSPLALPPLPQPHSPVSSDLTQIQAQLTHLQAAREWLETSQTQLKQEIVSHQPLVSEARVQSLEQEVTQLKEVIQLGQSIINERLETLQTRLTRLEGTAPLPPLAEDDLLPDDEPDEILTDFLEPGMEP